MGDHIHKPRLGCAAAFHLAGAGFRALFRTGWGFGLLPVAPNVRMPGGLCRVFAALCGVSVFLLICRIICLLAVELNSHHAYSKKHIFLRVDHHIEFAEGDVLQRSGVLTVACGCKRAVQALDNGRPCRGGRDRHIHSHVGVFPALDRNDGALSDFQSHIRHFPGLERIGVYYFLLDTRAVKFRVRAVPRQGHVLDGAIGCYGCALGIQDQGVDARTCFHMHGVSWRAYRHGVHAGTSLHCDSGVRSASSQDHRIDLRVTGNFKVHRGVGE